MRGQYNKFSITLNGNKFSSNVNYFSVCIINIIIGVCGAECGPPMRERLGGWAALAGRVMFLPRSLRGGCYGVPHPGKKKSA